MMDERARLYETKYKKACDVITELSKIYDGLRGCLDTIYESEDCRPAWFQILDDLKKFQMCHMRDIDKMTIDDIEEREETKMTANYNAEYIKGFLKGQEERLRQRRLDPDYIETLVEQADYLIERETDPECMKYITETFVEKISEHFYLGLNDKKFVNTLYGMVLDGEGFREIAMRAIGLVVIAGCTGDYPSITNQ